jgi:2-polyprenyl-3-methyl-5-hydroxy-6-metoxy-1,4-benzoquinol methylase
MQIPYDRKYVEKYHKKPGRRYENILKNIKINPSDKILDIGCGSGFLYETLHKKNISYQGIDSSKEFIELCKKKFKNNKNAFFTKTEIISFLDDSKTFTKAFMIDFTEHVEDKELNPIFKKTQRALLDNGELIIHTPNGDYFLEILKNKNILKQIPGHVAIRNSKQYKELLKKNGFNEIKTIYLPHYNILRHLHFLKFIPLIGKYFEARLLIIAKK